MIKTTTNDVITSTELLLSYASNKREIIKGIALSHRLTDAFISTFREHIDKDVFTLSYKLTPEMSSDYPDLFDRNIFVENLSMLICRNMLSIEMLSDYIDDVKEIKNNEGDCDGDECDNCSEIEDHIIDIIRTADKSSMTTDILTPIIGVFSESVTEFLLKRTDDDEIKNTIMLLLSIDDESHLTSSTMKYLDNATKEDILGTDDVNPEDFINTLSGSSDYGWIRKLLNKVKSGEIKLRKTTVDFSKTAITVVANLPEDLAKEVLVLRKYMPYALNGKVFQWILENKDYSESTLVYLINDFKAAGLYFKLKQYATKNNFQELLDGLKL